MGKRTGRKRKSGPAVSRKPCGRLSTPTPTERREAATVVAYAQRRAHGAKEGDEQAQAHGYELGRLWKAGKLHTGKGPKADEEARDLHDAGLWYASLHAAMRAAIESPQPTPTAIPLGDAADGGEEAESRLRKDASAADWGTPERDARSVLRAIQRHRDAERAIPRDAKTTVWAVLIAEEPETPAWRIPLLVEALKVFRAQQRGQER